MQINGKSQWDFCCEWYGVDGIQQSIANNWRPELLPQERIPADIRSREFAEWLAHQYRLAMNKGMEIAERTLLGAMGSCSPANYTAIKIAEKQPVSD